MGLESTRETMPTSAWQRLQAQLASFHLLFNRPLRAVLLVALLSGLLNFFVIPPWWHYDEPTQFEYAWLVANRAHWPGEKEFDPALHREMARSMESYGWYTRRNYTPDFGSSDIWIGSPQTQGPPAYYFIASLPLRLMRGMDVTLQLRAVRLVSLLLYLLTILLIWKSMGELVSEGNPLQWLITGFVALLPAFTDVMVSVNDDAGAVLVSCLFLWLSIRLVRRGVSVSRLLAWAVSLVLCYLAKSSAWYALLLAPVVLLFSLLRGRFVRAVWAATPVVILAMALVILEGGGVASWYQDQTQAPPLRIKTASAPVGSYAFQLDYAPGRLAIQTGQYVNKELIAAVRGKTVTLGAWIWAEHNTQVQTPLLQFVTQDEGFVSAPGASIPVPQAPAFFQTVFSVPANADYAIVVPPYAALNTGHVRIFFDGIVLTEGAYLTGSPVFSDSAASEGTWNGHPFRNLIDNASAEQGALRARRAVDQKTEGVSNRIGNLSAIVSIVQDWRGIGWYYVEVLKTMLRTFWASVAADKFNLPGTAPNNILFALTIVGVIGSARLLWRRRSMLRWDLVYMLGAAFLFAWGLSVFRGTPSLFTAHPLFPWARYTFPVILPAALLICAGWAEWLDLLGEKYRLSRRALYLLPLGMMGLLSLYTLFNVEKYFHPSLISREWLLWLLGILVAASLFLIRRNQILVFARDTGK